MDTAHDPYAALRFRDYRFLLAASILSTFGSEVLAAAVGWELYERTESPGMLGLAGLAQFLPVLLLALPAGQTVDHFSRKTVLQLALATTCLAGGGLALLSWLEGPVSIVFVCLVLTGCARAFSVPARSALVSQVVPPPTLANAVTWNSGGFHLANVVGPSAAGLVIAGTYHAVECYLLAASCALASLLLLSVTRPRPQVRGTSPGSLASLLAGVRFVFRSELLLAAITLDLFAVLLGGATALLPIFARDILKEGPEVFGALRAAPAIGAILTALVLAHRPPLRRAGVALLLAVAGFGLATVGFGLSREPVLSFLLLALTGALDNVSVVVRGTLMQTLTPDEMRGRVSAVNSVFISSSNELGAFESGITAEWFGPVASVVGGGIGTIAVVVLAALRWPILLRLGPLHDLAAERKSTTDGTDSTAGERPTGSGNQ